MEYTNMFEGVNFNQMQFIWPLIILFVTILLFAIIYKLLFQRILPRGIFNFLIGPICLFGLYVWLIPMNLGFYELFK